MPRTRSLAWAQLRIGVLTIVALFIAGLTIFMLTGTQGFFWQRYKLKTRFSNVAGLKPGSPVRVAGVEVGSVDATTLTGDMVEVAFQVNKEYRDRITTQSTAVLGSVSLLGEASVDITPSLQGMPLPDNSFVPEGHQAAQLSDVTTQASEGIQELTGMIHDVRQGRGTVGRLMTDDQLYVALQQFVASANDLTQGLRQGRGSLGKLLNDPKTADALEASVKNIEDLTRQLNSGQGSLGKLLKDDSFARSLNGATNGLDTLVAKLNSGQGTAGKLIADPVLFDRMNQMTERLNDLVNGLNQGEGTAGQLLKDKQLYENMNKVVNEFHSLITKIEQDPRKYLNVKVSIF
jgi:phospholipid/cholesterol/gamma-HCH transport system substrate-binding protein